MKNKFEKSINITFTDTTVTIKSAVDETAKDNIVKLAQELV